MVGAQQYGYHATRVTVDPAAWDAWQRYDQALFTLAAQSGAPERLDPTYGRLPSTAIRIALLLCIAEWAQGPEATRTPPVLRLAHWVAAQEIVERWRHDAHRVLATALRDEKAAGLAKYVERLVQLLMEKGGRVNRGEAQRSLNWTKAVLDEVLTAGSGRVRQVQEETGGRPAEVLELVVDAGTKVTGPEAFSAFSRTSQLPISQPEAEESQPDHAPDGPKAQPAAGTKGTKGGADSRTPDISAFSREVDVPESADRGGGQISEKTTGTKGTKPHTDWMEAVR